MSEQQPTILIIDDDSTNIDLLLTYFELSDFHVITANTGKSGIQQALTQQPNLILLDVMMPGIDGFETCRRLKANPSTRDIPVIFMTALSETKTKLTGFEVGGVDYIAKPFYHEEVLARVNVHLSLQRLQAQLQNQNRQLQTLNDNKDRFLSIIANDLKKPFASIFIAAEETRQHLDARTYDRAGQSIEQLQAAIDNYSDLLDNLLLWSQLQHDLIPFHPQALDMANIVAKQIALFTPHALEKGITVYNHLSDRLPIRADLNMLDTTIRNLLSNAIKFTKPDGSVGIQAHTNHDAVTLNISDTGVGIPQEKLPALFRIDTPYRQLGTSDEKGTGLGLILCNEFVKKHGGRIWAESQIGQGSTFHIELPLSPGTPGA